MRSLASIQKIVDIRPIEGADKIEVATVLGWECVVQKSNKFTVGDYVVFIEPDSVCPETPTFEFLRSRKFRVGTIKLKGQVSQGLVMPMSILPYPHMNDFLLIGHDVTDDLKIKKYDPELEAENRLVEKRTEHNKSWIYKFIMKHKILRNFFHHSETAPFPSFLKKTNEDRIQNMPWVLEKIDADSVCVTEKLDGSSVTMFLMKNPHKWQFWKKHIFGVCSRNIWLKSENNSWYWRIARQISAYQVLKKLIHNNDYICLQGEIVGSGIQRNKYGYHDGELGFFAFNLILPSEKITTPEMESILLDYGIDTVPILDEPFDCKTVQEAVEYSKDSSVFGCFDEKTRTIVWSPREGIVVRTYNGNISFKVINPDFLLSNQE